MKLGHFFVALAMALVTVVFLNALTPKLDAQDGNHDEGPLPSRFIPFEYHRVDSAHWVRVVRDRKTTRCFLLVETMYSSEPMAWDC